MSSKSLLLSAVRQKYVWILRSVVMLLILMALCGVAWYQSNGIPLGIAGLGVAVIFLGLAPGIVFLANPTRSSFPILPLNCSFYALAFGYGIFRTIKDPRYIVPELSTQNALFFLVAGLTSQILVYYVAMSFLGTPTPIGFSKGLSLSSILFLGWAFIGTRFLQLLVPQLNEIPSFSQFANLCGVIGTALLYSQRSLGGFGKISRIALYLIVVPIELIARATSGSIANLMIYCILFIVIRWMIEKRVAWIFLITLIAGYAILAPLKGQYRDQTWNDQYSEATMYSKATIYYDIIIENLSSGSEGIDAKLVDASVDRFNHLPLYALVVDTTPDRVSYWNGETLIGILYVFIPRFLWQDKPRQTLGNVFGQRYGILSQSDTGTSINLCWNIELYANFGLIGIILGMGFFGFVFALLEMRSGSDEDNQTDRIIVIALTLGLAYPESNIILMWGGLLLNTLAILAIFRLSASFQSNSSVAK